VRIESSVALINSSHNLAAHNILFLCASYTAPPAFLGCEMLSLGCVGGQIWTLLDADGCPHLRRPHANVPPRHLRFGVLVVFEKFSVCFAQGLSDTAFQLTYKLPCIAPNLLRLPLLASAPISVVVEIQPIACLSTASSRVYSRGSCKSYSRVFAVPKIKFRYI
jgi:hypothetical protein